MQGERYSPSLEPFCIQHNKEKVMPDAVVVRRHKESREGKESGCRWAESEVKVATTHYNAWLYASHASCASRRICRTWACAMYVSHAHCKVRPSMKSRTTLLGSSCRSWSGGYGVRKSLRWNRLTMPFSLCFEGLRTRLPNASISTHRRFQSRVSGN